MPESSCEEPAIHDQLSCRTTVSIAKKTRIQTRRRKDRSELHQDGIFFLLVKVRRFNHVSVKHRSITGLHLQKLRISQGILVKSRKVILLKRRDQCSIRFVQGNLRQSLKERRRRKFASWCLLVSVWITFSGWFALDENRTACFQSGEKFPRCQPELLCLR